MKVEITRVQKVVVDIGNCKDHEIEDRVLDKYNSMTDKDFPIINTEMSYKVFPREAKELGVKYKIIDFAEFVVDYAYKNYDGIKQMALQVVLYMMAEHYYKKGIKIFDDDFVTYGSYPKSKQVYSRYCVYVATTISPLFSRENKLVQSEIDIDVINTLDYYLTKYIDIKLFDIPDRLLDTVWGRMVRAGLLDKNIELL